LAAAALVWLGSMPALGNTIANAFCLATQVSQLVSAQCSQAQTFPTSIPGLEVTGSGEATADLTTGTLRSRSVGQAYQTGTDDLYAPGGATAEFQDTITIGGGFTGTVQLRMEITGSFLMSDPTFPSGAPQMATLLQMWIPGTNTQSQVSAFVKQYNSPFEVYQDAIVITGNGTFASNAKAPGGNRASFADPSDVRIVLTTTLAVTPSSPTFTFFARLGTSAAVASLVDTNGEVKTSELDFGNTAHLSLILPAGVSWTSESGVFLQSVPEPSAGVQVAAGLFCTALVRRMRGASVRGRIRRERPSPG
jgi:hypothetical protein